MIRFHGGVRMVTTFGQAEFQGATYLPQHLFSRVYSLRRFRLKIKAVLPGLNS